MAMQTNKIISWNVNGLNSAHKRQQVFHWLNKQNILITFLQEVNIRSTEQKYLKNKRLGEEFASLIGEKKRETVIYAKKEVSPQKKFTDEEIC